MKRILIFYIALICIGASQLYAQEEVWSGGKTMTLQDCLRYGLEHNYSVRLIKNAQEQSDNAANVANAGLLPNVSISGGYGLDLNSSETKQNSDGATSSIHNSLDQSLNIGLQLDWTLFDGFSIWTNYRQLQLLQQQGELHTRIVIEDYIASLTAEYYNFVQQRIRLKNFRYAVKLSKERMRIVEERYHIGNFSRLDYQQAKVDFNADSAAYMRQQEALKTSCIRLNELMAMENVTQHLHIPDTAINVLVTLDHDVLMQSMYATNSSLLKAQQDEKLSEMDLKKVLSRNYPYVKLNGGYGYTWNKYEISNTSRRTNWGPNIGLTVGFNLFDGKRRTDRKNARIDVESAKLERENIELTLVADMQNLWQAYQNNVQVLDLERQNLIAAIENHEIASERYLLGDLSGFEMREAQKSLLDAEERILKAEYETKMCEISLLQLSGNIMMYLR